MDKRSVPPKIVNCAHCGKRIHISESKSYAEFGKGRMEYFCSTKCALAKLFGIVSEFRHFTERFENVS